MKQNIKELARLDFLIDLKNQMVKELVLNEFNVASLNEKEIMTPMGDSNVTEGLDKFRKSVEGIKRSIKIVQGLIAKEITGNGVAN